MNDNIWGCSHVDSYRSRPQTREFDKGYRAIDWSKTLETEDKKIRKEQEDGEPVTARKRKKD